MLTDILQFLVSAAVIVVAGTWLSKFADAIAELSGLGGLLVGGILLAGATSLPELSVDIHAVLHDMPDLAFGDLMGSSLFNLAILAALDLSVHSRGRMLSRKAARHALSGNLGAALIAMVAVSLLARPILGRELLGVGRGLWLVAAGYLLGVRMIYLDQQVSRISGEAVEQAAVRTVHGSLPRAVAGFAVAAIVIMLTGPFLSRSAGNLAEATGLGKTFIGTTLVALTTSLPELVTVFAALRLGAVDLAIGDLFGSNAFNMLLLIPLDALHTGSLLEHVSEAHAVTCLAAVLATLVAVLGQLYHVESRRRFIEPDATLMLVIIFGSLWMIYQLG